MPEITVRQPRAQGTVRLRVRDSARGSELADLRQSGSLRALFPRCDANNLNVVLTNTSGGVTGGDRFFTDVTADQDAVLTLTTQAAERAYRAAPGEIGRIENRLCVKSGARINWLPQETILFQGCALERQLTIELSSDASVLVVEPLIFGRREMREAVSDAQFSDRIEILREGRPLFLDRMALSGDLAAQLARPAVGAGAGAMATILFIHDAAETYLVRARDLLPTMGGASLVQPGVLAIRLLAADSFVLRQSMIPLINLLHDDDLPRPWMI